MTRALVLAAAALLAAAASSSARAQPPAPPPPGSESAEIEELRRELRHLRAQMQSVKSAVAEAAELEKMSTGALNRALKVLGDTPSAVSESAPPSPPARPAGQSAASRVAGRSLPSRRPLPPPEPTSTVRGKVEVPQGEPVAFVFVENVRGPAVNTKVTIEQVRKQFVPAWAVVQRGTMVEFPNLDNIFHNVFSLSAGNAFDLGLYSSAKAGRGHRFMEPGGVDIYCNIHPQMAAGVLVVPSRHFAQVKGDGTFELQDVPAGRRKIVAWAPGSRLAGTWVDAGGGESVAVTLRLERKSGRHKRKDGRPYGSYD